MLRAVLAIASIALSVYALADCIQTPEDRVRGIPRWAWILLIVLIPWVGPLTWLLTGKGPARRPAARPLAPDEDPEFLRRLDEDIRRERRRRERGGEPGAEDDDLG